MDLKLSQVIYSRFPIQLTCLVNIEADNIHIVALADYFRVKVRVVTIDTAKLNSETDIIQEIVPDDLTDKDPPIITLFFKPGHYDILYE